MYWISIALVVVALGACASSHKTSTPATQSEPALGNFSVSLSVKDIAASRAFYEKLGFRMVSGDQSKNWVVLRSGETKIGLFQGMFPKNTLTFNPGWDSDKATLKSFDDVRELQKIFKARGLTPNPAADEASTGPAYFMLMDPDGNPILFDQHVPRPQPGK